MMEKIGLQSLDKTRVKCISCKWEETLHINSLYLCPNCDLVFAYPMDVLIKYDASYVGALGFYPQNSKMRLELIKSVVSSGQILDIGYGNGAFLKTAELDGFEVFGIDIHGLDYGIRSHDGLKKQIVTMFDVLEHLPNLRQYDNEIKQAEVLVISTPLRPKWFPYEEKWKHFKHGEHLTYFTERSLLTFVKQYGFNKFNMSDMEDATRGKLPDGNQNILTVLCRRVPLV